MASLGKKQLAFEADAHYSGQNFFFSEIVTGKSNFFRDLLQVNISAFNQRQSQHTKSELISYPNLFSEFDYHY